MNQVYGLFVFTEDTIASHMYLDILQNFRVQQLNVKHALPGGSLLYYYRDVTEYLN
jgi:hypothetical protein